MSIKDQDQALPSIDGDEVAFRFPKDQKVDSLDPYCNNYNSDMALWRENDARYLELESNYEFDHKDNLFFGKQIICDEVDLEGPYEQTLVFPKEEEPTFSIILPQESEGFSFSKIHENRIQIEEVPIWFANHPKANDYEESSYKVRCGGQLNKLVPYLMERLNSSFFEEFYAKQVSPNRSRGRPRKIKDTDKDTLWAEILDKLVLKANDRKAKQRADAKNTSVCRDVKKVVDHILKYIGSKCRYKSANMAHVIESYTEAFTVGFVPIIFEGEALDNKVKTFCEFIIIAYPKEKVQKIITMIKEAGFLDAHECENFMSQLNNRKKSSKANFQRLVRQNSCFKSIILKLLSKLDHCALNGKESYKDVLRSILYPNFIPKMPKRSRRTKKRS
ncbi:unnamed protein product [Moneuplotes crassus]|uniref:Uncharacterized protein n=1 Tax=Euplotes crassus TaxID=5936 RepID=A0AAD1UJ38_EUPCR|nr:unnamed protein product [Moneuplotes crassus]